MTRTMKINAWLFTIAAALGVGTGAARAADEVCGDGADNASTTVGMTDEGCHPFLVTGLCESPLSCLRAGAVAPKLGALVHFLQADVTPVVPYGPGIPFRRFYMSKYAPGYNFPSATDYKAPMGYRWHHNWMSWVKRTDVDSTPDYAVLHTTTGRDVFFDYSSSDGTYHYFVPQAGYEVDYLRQNKTTGVWDLRMLTGMSFEYDWNAGTLVGKLTKVKDSLATPNYVTITYNGDGQVEWVKNAGETKKLKFEYFSTGTKVLQYVKYYTNTGSDTLRVTVELTYVEQDSDRRKLYKAIVGGATVGVYAYDSDGYLTTVSDGSVSPAPQTHATFTYLSEGGNTAGKLVRAETTEGDVGYRYSASGCDSGNGTYVYFHRANATACDADADCGTGLFCGGESTPGTGNTGACFKARRCLTVATPNEHLVDAVSNPDSCPSCIGVKDYTWDTASGAMDLTGVQSADSIWTSYEYNSNGMVTKMVEGDDNANPNDTNPTGVRITYYKYGNSSFPGLVTEVRRLSQLKPGGTCTDSLTTDCKRTIYAYTTDGLLDTVNEKGFTYNSSGSVVSYDFTTDWDYDSKGRVTIMKGPRASIDDDVEFTYYGSGNGLNTDYLNERKRKKAASTYITTTFAEYDFWGKPGRETDPNSKSICYDYSDSYGLVSTRRQVVDGSHSDCTQTAGSNDETTQYWYDPWRQLIQVMYPRANCMTWAYDSEGRLTTLTERDAGFGCLSSGNYISYSYDADNHVNQMDWKDSSGALKYQRKFTYRVDRRLDTDINPANTNYHKKWYYDDDGVPAKVEFEDYSTSDAKTEWDVDNLNRTTAVRRYTAAASSEDWTITQAAQLFGLPTEIADEASHDIDLVWDDLGRKVKEVTEEKNTTILVYDEAGNLTTLVEDYGGAGQQTTTNTYDWLNRLTAVNTGDATCFTSGGAEIQYTYDALSGVSCPTGSSCNLLSGRLAYVKTVMWCDDAKSDDTFDQETFYSYDEAGRIKQHTVQDDSGRLGKTDYTFDKNGNVTRIDYPSGSSAGAVYTYGDGSYASDDDRVVTVKRNTTTILDQVRWNPLGPVKSYRQQNRYSTALINVNFNRNNAYRMTSIDSGTASVFKIDYAEDVRGRYTKRDFTYGTASQRDMFFIFDDLSRATCRRKTTGSTCPTSGTDLIENIAYNASSDRSTIRLANSIYGNQLFTANYASSTSDRLSSYTKGNYSIAFSHDTLGRRTADDDSEWGEGFTFPPTPDYDRRVYTYDGRNNLVSISGKYLYAASDWNNYTISYVYDERNRLIFKSFLDEDLDDEAQWFFYWDQFDRLIEVKHTPDITDSNTYSVFQWYWLGDRPFLYYQINYPGASTSRRYLQSDEQGRPLAAWSWPTIGDGNRVWEVDPGLFGWDEVTVGTSIYQPLRFPGQLYDEDSEAYRNNGTGSTMARPGVSYNRYRSYDPFTGTYLQMDPLVYSTWDGYGYANNSPVLWTDPLGLGAIGDAVNTVQAKKALEQGSGSGENINDNVKGPLWSRPRMSPFPFGDDDNGPGHGDSETEWLNDFLNNPGLCLPQSWDLQSCWNCCTDASDVLCGHIVTPDRKHLAEVFRQDCITVCRAFMPGAGVSEPGACSEPYTFPAPPPPDPQSAVSNYRGLAQ